jgi:hypothetical protein
MRFFNAIRSASNKCCEEDIKSEPSDSVQLLMIWILLRT